MRNWIIFTLLLIILAACGKPTAESIDSPIPPAAEAANNNDLCKP